MINSNNQQMMFDLLYKYWISNEKIDHLNEYISYLKEELRTIEANDITSINPNNFQGELRGEWLHFVQCKGNFLH